MTAPDDPGFVAKLVAGVAAALATVASALLGLVWGDMKRRVSRVEAKLDGKADKEELTRQRDHVEVLFEGQVEIRREIQQTSEKLTDQIHKMHLDLIEKIDERRQRR